MMTAFHYDKDHIIKRSRVEGLSGVIFKKPVDPVRLREVILETLGKDGVIQPPARRARPRRAQRDHHARAGAAQRARRLLERGAGGDNVVDEPDPRRRATVRRNAPRTLRRRSRGAGRSGSGVAHAPQRGGSQRHAARAGETAGERRAPG